MHRRLCTYALTGLLTLGMAAGTLFAQNNSTPPSQTSPMPMRGYHRMTPETQLQHMTQMLDLTSDQQSQMKPILEARHKDMQAIWQDQSLTRQERHQKMMDIWQNYRGKIEGVLNDTQKKKYEDMMANMRNRRMGRGMGQGMGPGMMGQSGTPPANTSSQPPK